MRPDGARTFRAHAKINLTLEVTGRAEDGMHTLASVMQTVGLHDTLTLEAGGRGVEVLNDAVEGAEELGGRAARALAERAGGEAGARLLIRKGIPLAAGMGGGSADAAAVLHALNRHWRLGMGLDELLQIGFRLGADVPFLLCGGTALVTGRGEAVERITPAADFPVLLHSPRAEMRNKTARAFAALGNDAHTDGARSLALRRKLGKGAAPADADLFNVFEGVIERLMPDWPARRDALEAAIGAPAHLTGAGPAMFALPSSREEGAEWQARLARAGIDAALTEACAPIG